MPTTRPRRGRPVLLQRVRRATADISTSRKRLGLRIARLEASVRRSGARIAARPRRRPAPYGLSVEQVAEGMGTTADAVAVVERDGPDAVETGTLAAYPAALGGRLEVVAEFGAERLRLRQSTPQPGKPVTQRRCQGVSTARA